MSKKGWTDEVSTKDSSSEKGTTYMLEQKHDPQHGSSTPTTDLEKKSIEALKAGLQGALLQPGDDAYDSARRVWNGMIDRKPALIVCCAGVADVIQAVNFARTHCLLVSVRGGGHNVAGNAVCEGGIVIDLSGMKGIRVDPVTRTAWVEAGSTLGEFVRETQKFGLGTTVGTVSETGLSGLTLGGGMGWLMGKYGLTVDNLLAVDLVTADGQVRRASASEHPELFWGVRGSGGNLGIATSFTFQLHPVGTLLAGMVVHPIAQVQEVLCFYREFSRTAPDELTAYAVLATMPDGLSVILIALCYCGPLEEGERLIAPVRKFGPPLVDLIRPMGYFDLTTMIDATSPAGRHYYEKSSSLKELSDEAIERIAQYGLTVTSPFTLVLLQHVHGAACRIAPTQTAASALRAESYVITIMSMWEHDDPQRHIEWTRAFWTALQPFATSGVYINYLAGDEKEERVRASYGVNYERLVALKNTYDPTNFFRMNQNIKPTL
jgi:FAD/FMN-containing dehydrogenase